VLIPFKLSAESVSKLFIIFYPITMSSSALSHSVFKYGDTAVPVLQRGSKGSAESIAYGKSRKKRMAEQKNEPRLSKSHIHTSGPHFSFLHVRS